MDLNDIRAIAKLLKGEQKQLNYISMLRNEIIYYTKKGYIPKLKIMEMTDREKEKIVDYCFCIEYHKNYDDFIKTTNTGYISNITEIEKIIDKYKECDYYDD